MKKPAQPDFRARLRAIYGDKIVPVDSDYAKREYDVTDKELKAFVKRADAELKRDRRAGRITKYKGDIRAAIRD